MEEQEAKGRPFRKGKTLKLGELGWWVVSKSWVLRVSRAELGENGSLGLGVLDRMGLPAKAWDCRFIDMVVAVERWNSVVLASERGLRRRRWFLEMERTGEDEKERRRESMTASFSLFFYGLLEIVYTPTIG